jgi:hypothetical protein
MLWRSSVSDHTHDGDGHVVELGVAQTVEQVDRSGTGGRHTHPDPTRELGVTGGGEGGHLLVAGLDELRLIVGAAKRRHQAVDTVPGIGKNVLDSPLAQAFQYEVCDLLSHGAPSGDGGERGIRSH